MAYVEFLLGHATTGIENQHPNAPQRLDGGNNFGIGYERFARPHQGDRQPERKGNNRPHCENVRWYAKRVRNISRLKSCPHLITSTMGASQTFATPRVSNSLPDEVDSIAFRALASCWK